MRIILLKLNEPQGFKLGATICSTDKEICTR